MAEARTASPPTEASDDPLIGPADVRNHFDGRWSGGFRVVAAVPGDHGPRYRVVRCSDGTVLPVTFSASELRPEPRP